MLKTVGVRELTQGLAELGVVESGVGFGEGAPRRLRPDHEGVHGPLDVRGRLAGRRRRRPVGGRVVGPLGRQHALQVEVAQGQRHCLADACASRLRHRKEERVSGGCFI
jgi:hypothetical protein